MALADGDCRTDGIYYLIEATEWIASAYGSKKETKPR
jgi:hypothetical protein